MITRDEARANIGNKVVYRPANGPLTGEKGVITSVNDEYVFVRYGAETGSQATMPGDLTLVAFVEHGEAIHRSHTSDPEEADV